MPLRGGGVKLCILVLLKCFVSHYTVPHEKSALKHAQLAGPILVIRLVVDVATLGLIPMFRLRKTEKQFRSFSPSDIFLYIGM